MTDAEAGAMALALGAIRLLRKEIDEQTFIVIAGAAAMRAIDAPRDALVEEAATQEAMDRGFDVMVAWLEPRAEEALS